MDLNGVHQEHMYGNELKAFSSCFSFIFLITLRSVCLYSPSGASRKCLKGLYKHTDRSVIKKIVEKQEEKAFNSYIKETCSVYRPRCDKGVYSFNKCGYPSLPVATESVHLQQTPEGCTEYADLLLLCPQATFWPLQPAASESLQAAQTAACARGR